LDASLSLVITPVNRPDHEHVEAELSGDKIQPTYALMPNWNHIYEILQNEMNSLVGISIARLGLATILGGLIGLERQLKHRPAGLRTNLFICLGAAMYTLLSDELAVEHIGDHTRIAAQIIPGIGFIGAGSILHARNNLVTGLTTAATLFVVASVGMAVGGGLYLTSIFETGLILLCLFLLGRAEERFGLKAAVHAYEVAGRYADEITLEINRILECVHGMTDNLQVAATPQHVRVQFELEATRKDQGRVLQLLKQSPVFESATWLGPVYTE
jgi:putative Mg2+ transporter-C (MgtC) family protein